MLPPGVYINEDTPNEWRIYTPPGLVSSAGTISKPYPTREEALEAAKEGRYE